MAGDGFALRFDSVAYAASTERLMNAVLAMPSTATRARAGVRPGGGLEVTMTTGPDAANVAPGGGIITDTGAGAGSYIFVIPTSVAKTLATRPSAGQSRLDEVVAVIKNFDERPADGAGVREVDIAVIAGTPSAGTPAAPSIPAGQLRLAELTVPASGTILVAKPPPRISALGGVTPVTDGTERDAISPIYDGLMVYRDDTDVFEGRAGGAWAVLGGKTHACHVQRVAAQSMVHNASTIVSWDTEVRDTGTMWTAGAPTKVIIPVTGRYRITGLGSLNNTAAGTFQVAVAVNGTDTVALWRGLANASPSQPTLGGRATELDLSAGDEITMKIFQNSGADKNTSTGIYVCELIVAKVP